ncbi:hypothetical protein TNCV_3088701 [Trichonephila clavipes]|uniref:Uncharacterized protein n=1 Tax=Trichonephila clavipes TaxID=2585209 RepID=A0A8X6RNA6_TRICX|nr:hypothetical protein TNCV_3088701 [Trichonephila clavipes]
MVAPESLVSTGKKRRRDSNTKPFYIISAISRKIKGVCEISLNPDPRSKSQDAPSFHFGRPTPESFVPERRAVLSSGKATGVS